MRGTNERRHDKTIGFVKKHFVDDRILDLGVDNEMAWRMRDEGYDVRNTTGDLDTDYRVRQCGRNITAFEIFEHLFAPFNILNNTSGKLIASVPINLWFAKAYWNNADPRDCHYHEFEKRQFDHLLKRTGWTVKDSKCITGPRWDIGFRPILRLFYKRHYIIYAEK